MFLYTSPSKRKTREIYKGVNMDKDSLATRIRISRESLNYSQHDLARVTGISQQQISSYEKGQRLPSAPALIKLSDALHVSTDYILTGEYIQKDYDIQLNLLSELESEERKILLEVLKVAMRVIKSQKAK